MKECNKKAFINKIEANKRLREIISVSNKLVVPIRVYKCKKCNQWHLTSTPKNRLFNIKKEAEYQIKKNNW